MTTILAFFVQGFGIGLTAAASPGPFQAYLIHRSLTNGWRNGALIALAPLISDAPIIFAMLLLIDHVPGEFLRIVRLVGGIYVLYLAWSLWKQWRKSPEVELSDPTGNSNSGLWRGVLMNALSPGPYTFWAFVSGPLLASALKITWFHGGAFLLGFYLSLIGGFCLIAVVFAQARHLGFQVVRSLILVSIILLVIFAFILISQGMMN